MKHKAKTVIAFSATINGKDVRLTVYAQDLDIVSRDNWETYGASMAAELENIEFEEIYQE